MHIDTSKVQALIARMLSRIEDFNTSIINLPIPTEPSMIQGARKDWFLTAAGEELQEFQEAETVVDQADALMDLVVFTLGRLVEMGVPAQAVFDEIDRANMDKVQGSLSKRPGSLGHDAVKPEGWRGPDHSWLVDFSITDVVAAKCWDDLFMQVGPGEGIEPMVVDMPKVLIIGHARHGKDTVAEYLRDQYGFTFTSSSQWAAERIMMPYFASIGMPYETVEECFADRVNHRSIWFDQIAAFCRDGTELAENIFAEVDIYAGIRSAREFNAVKNANLPDVIIWVDALKRLPPEPASSMELEPWMADYVLDNNGTEEQLRQQIDILMGTILG